jgi:hypothetical protein
VLPVVLRGTSARTFAPRCASIPARHREVDAGPVAARDAAQIEGGARAAAGQARGLHARALTRGGMHELLLYGNRRRRPARDIVGTLTRTPRSAAARARTALPKGGRLARG